MALSSKRVFLVFLCLTVLLIPGMENLNYQICIFYVILYIYRLIYVPVHTIYVFIATIYKNNALQFRERDSCLRIIMFLITTLYIVFVNNLYCRICKSSR